MKELIKEPNAIKVYKEAEAATKSGDFEAGLHLYKKVLKKYPENGFLIQRLALVTYKNAEQDSVSTLFEAENILHPLHPNTTTNLETLGLSGAINKRLYEELNEPAFLDKSLWYYKKGFTIHRDYYNGINTAYLYTIKSLTEKDKFNAFADFGMASSIWKKVIQVCDAIINDKAFVNRDDKEWVYQSLSQAYLGTEKMDDVIGLLPIIQELSKGDFDMETFRRQNHKLIVAIDAFKNKHT